MDIFEIFGDMSGCLMIAIIGVIIIVLVICVILALGIFGLASWF